MHYLSTVAAGLLIFATTAAHAQTHMRHCGPRDSVIERLTGKFGETRQSVGLGGNNQMLEVYASDETGTWTIVVTSPAGLSCLLASGQAYEALEGIQEPEGDDV